MKTDDIRERYQQFFEQREHLRIPSASLVPSAHDPSALLTVAGMHPLKPYFLGLERPPAPRLTDCQKVFRTVDIDNVGNTARHLTFFEMLGNFSFGDYFKHDAISFAWELSLEVFGLQREDIWVTVFEGDEDLDLGPDEEAIDRWVQVGVPRERIVACPRSENFWQAGPTGPCGPCSELYLDRGVEHGKPDDLPGGENERFLEYWNLVFMQYEQHPPGHGAPLSPLPAKNIDTGLGLNRMAAILQDVTSVFETDHFVPLIELGEELGAPRYGENAEADRGLRILADHGRAMTFLTADGVVPSNEDRGYVLRRVMRRAIAQGRSLEFAPGFLVRYAERVRELMGSVYPELHEQREVTDMWLASEEEGFSRTIAQGMQTLGEYVQEARAGGKSTITAEQVFRLHDTYGFPQDMTSELLAREGLKVEGDFEELMDEQRRRGRATARRATGDTSELVAAAATLGGEAPAVRFTGYENREQQTSVLAVGDGEQGLQVVKLADSPFYAPGGGQIADTGVIEALDGAFRGRVVDVLRLGDDQALAVEAEEGELAVGEQVLARVDRRERHATEANHTATHLLQAALRRVLGEHVRQAGSYVGPDKLRFDFSHGQALSAAELERVEELVNGWVSQNDPVHAITTTLDEAKRMGAMALFGEKYGEIVRLVEVGEGDYSRELCGGTHVRSTAEIGPFTIVAETSSSANVRRIEALTGPAAVEHLLARDRVIRDVAAELRTRPDEVAEAVRRLAEERKRLEREVRQGAGATGVDAGELAGQAEALDGTHLLAATVDVTDAKALMETLDRVRGQLGSAAVVLGAVVDDRVHLAVGVSDDLIPRGVKAGAVVKVAAAEVGGGGGGRDGVAQAGGRDPAGLPRALDAAREAIREALGA